MKHKIITMTTCILLILLVTTMHAQVRKSVLSLKRDSVILREGNTNYLREGVYNYDNPTTGRVHNTIERVDTKDLKGKSYENVNWMPNVGHREFMRDLYRSVFSKERAKQLDNMWISCTIIISPAASEKITHVRFSVLGNENENSPLQLSELNELERRIRAEPKVLPPFEGSGKIVDHGEAWTLPPIDFNRLYE